MCLKSHYGGKTPLNPSYFKLNKYYLKRFDTDKKLMVIKVFNAVCYVLFDFDNLIIPYLVIWESFGRQW